MNAFNGGKYALAYPYGIESCYWMLARNSIIKQQLVRKGINNSVILEVGCGKGIVVDYLRNCGFNCWGSEIGEVVPIKRVKHHIFLKDFRCLPDEFYRTVKTVLILDVLEHLQDPGNFISDIKKYFPFLEHMIVTVPSRSELWSNYDEFYGHKERYSMERLKDLFRDKSFWEVDDVRYIFHALYIPAFIMAVLCRERRIMQKAPKGIIKHLHRLFAWLLLLDYMLLPKRLIGTSILARVRIVRKQ